MALNEDKLCKKCNEVKLASEFHKRSNRKSGLAASCKTCCKVYHKGHYEQNKDVILSKNKIYAKANIEVNRKKGKKWKEANAEKIRQYERTRRKNDAFFRLKKTLRERIRDFMKRASVKKTSSTRDLLGADPFTVKEYLQDQFRIGMSWDNHGDWHIDHKVPLASATTEEELRKLFHYTNLQPLWAIDNMVKSDKILHYAA